MKNAFFTALVCCFLIFSCQDTATDKYVKATNPQQMAPIKGEYLNMIVTIPAGSTQRLRYEASTNTYERLRDSSGQILPPTFMPFPANYGFLPATQQDSVVGSDLEVLLISERQTTASLIPVLPIGAIRLLENGEEGSIIIAIPARENEQLIKVNNFLDFAIQHDAAKQILEIWLLNYKGPRTSSLLGWEDEFYAWQLVKNRYQAPEAPTK